MARVGATVITVEDLQAQINAQPAPQRARFTDDRGRKSVLDDLVRQTLLVNEARARGLDKHPEVQRVARQQMIALLVQREVDDKVRLHDVSDADVEKYYREQTAELSRSGEVPPLEQVREQLRQRLYLIARSRKMETLLSELRARTDIELFQDRLARITIDAPDATAPR